MNLISSTVVDSWLANQKEITKLFNKKRKNVAESCIGLISHFLFAFEQGVGWEINQCRLKCLGNVVRFWINTILLDSSFVFVKREMTTWFLWGVNFPFIYIVFWKVILTSIFHPLSKNFKPQFKLKPVKLEAFHLWVNNAPVSFDNDCFDVLNASVLDGRLQVLWSGLLCCVLGQDN